MLHFRKLSSFGKNAFTKVHEKTFKRYLNPGPDDCYLSMVRIGYSILNACKNCKLRSNTSFFFSIQGQLPPRKNTKTILNLPLTSKNHPFTW